MNSGQTCQLVFCVMIGQFSLPAAHQNITLLFHKGIMISIQTPPFHVLDVAIAAGTWFISECRRKTAVTNSVRTWAWSFAAGSNKRQWIISAAFICKSTARLRLKSVKKLGQSFIVYSWVSLYILTPILLNYLLLLWCTLEEQRSILGKGNKWYLWTTSLCRWRSKKGLVTWRYFRFFLCQLLEDRVLQSLIACSAAEK